MLWYPTQAKTGLEWGTQPLFGAAPTALRSSSGLISCPSGLGSRLGDWPSGCHSSL